MRPAAHLLFLRAQEKKAKEVRPTSATPALRSGANLRRASDGVGRRTHCALAALRSDSCGQPEHEAAASFGAAATPPDARRRRSLKGGGTATQAIAALGLGQRGASRPRVGGRAQRWPERTGPLCACRGAQGVGWAVAAQHATASCSGSLRLFERSAASAQRVPQCRPRIEHRRLPCSEAEGTRAVGALSLPTFLRVQESGSPAGAKSRPPTSIKHQEHQKR